MTNAPRMPNPTNPKAYHPRAYRRLLFAISSLVLSVMLIGCETGQGQQPALTQAEIEAEIKAEKIRKEQRAMGLRLLSRMFAAPRE